MSLFGSTSGRSYGIFKISSEVPFKILPKVFPELISIKNSPGLHMAVPTKIPPKNSSSISITSPLEIPPKVN